MVLLVGAGELSPVPAFFEVGDGRERLLLGLVAHGQALTVTATVATFAPSLVVAVTLAVPAVTPVTTPVSGSLASALTVAVASALLAHVTVLSVASSG